VIGPVHPHNERETDEGPMVASRPRPGLATAGGVLASGAGAQAAARSARKLDHVKHIVVVYEENHSVDNLYGG